MLVEAVFWFHPLVWWISARLTEERERACDERVLELGSEPQVYAESILKTCEFCVESPLTCVSGVTGADLKKRIVRIMTELSPNELSFGKKILLAAFGVSLVVGSVVLGLVNAPRIRAQSTQTTTAPFPSFEVVSIKPNRSGETGRRWDMLRSSRVALTNVTTNDLIAMAYNLYDYQIWGGPSWVNSEKLNVDAREEDSVAQDLQKLPRDERLEKIRLMIQSLLADRFNLSVSHKTKDLPVYVLVIAKNGPKIQKSKPGDTYPNGIRIKGPNGSTYGAPILRVESSRVTGQGVPTESLARLISQQLRRTVVDKTGLRGDYDFTLQWTSDQSEAAMLKAADEAKPGSNSALPPEPAGPSIFTAIQEQLGLKLESTRGPVEIIVIDHIERPSEN